MSNLSGHTAIYPINQSACKQGTSIGGGHIETLIDPVTYDYIATPGRAEEDGGLYDMRTLPAYVQKREKKGWPILSAYLGKAVSYLTLTPVKSDDNDVRATTFMPALPCKVCLPPICLWADKPLFLSPHLPCPPILTTQADPATAMTVDEEDMCVARMMANFYRAVDPIRDILSDIDIRPPRVVIFGDQKAGM